MGVRDEGGKEGGHLLPLDVHPSISLFFPLRFFFFFFTFANERICMAEKEGGKGEVWRKTMRLKRKRKKEEMGNDANLRQTECPQTKT